MDPGRSEVVSRAAAALGGLTVYHSSFFLDPTVRGLGLAALLFRHAHLMVWQRWRPELFFGIAIPNSRNPTFAARMGYGGYEAEAFVWRSADPSAPEVKEGLVWSDPARMQQLSRNPWDGLPDRYGETGSAARL